MPGRERTFIDRILDLEYRLAALEELGISGRAATDQTIKGSHDRLDALFGAGASGDHGALLGLADDDHAQYVLEAACHVYNSANISIPDSAETLLTFDSERYDTDTMHSIALNTGRITFTTAGKYHVMALATFAANATGVRYICFYLSATGTKLAQTRWPNFGASIGVAMLCAVDYDFGAGDYVTVDVWQDSGGALNISTLANFSPEFMAHRIG